MAYLIKLPAVAADSSGGTLYQWLKQEGDVVAVGDALAEVETEKAIVEINAENSGVLARILVPAGTTAVEINTVIGVLLTKGEAAEAVDVALAEYAGTNTTPAAANLAHSAPSLDAPSSSRAQTEATEPIAPTRRLISSPLARRLAADWRIDLSTVQGTGPRGRILRGDVEAARHAGTTAQPDTALAGAASAAAASAAAASLAAASLAAASAAAGSPAAGSPAANNTSHRVPHSGMRRAIARRLSESKQQIPHFYLTVDCRVDALIALRAQANEGGSIKVSLNDFIVRAAARALRDVPEVNVSWQDDAIEFHAGADISVAVATDGGLVTPIVRDADIKPLGVIATEIVELATRARINRLKPEEFTGGSLTVSNLGMYGVDQFAAIINPPQAAILAVGAAQRRPVVDADGEIRAATLMTVTLSADHRAIDGAVGARWLAAFRTLIENPIRLLL